MWIIFGPPQYKTLNRNSIQCSTATTQSATADCPNFQKKLIYTRIDPFWFNVL